MFEKLRTQAPRVTQHHDYSGEYYPVMGTRVSKVRRVTKSGIPRVSIVSKVTKSGITQVSKVCRIRNYPGIKVSMVKQSEITRVSGEQCNNYLGIKYDQGNGRGHLPTADPVSARGAKHNGVSPEGGQESEAPMEVIP